ncbi:hypothetical protein Verru16b_02593 [Lacunisphaera limnophila]|uniref:Uncharacterized protein n=1 Tax=Lacunisphaera limnophila TaxID=1838286 RepID=A0A1D8AX86_9BACT|nr:hypothetical protein [Lacunisphaera limnophila]AOS45512.1 hypothetical protein Verru16b_02593 [Lacunisphaera limnophila]
MNDELLIHWPYLLGALAMLWFPRQWLRNGARLFKRRRRSESALEKLTGRGARDPDDKSVHLGKEFTTFRNYIDLFRGLAGGYGLSTFAFTATGPDAATTLLLIQGGVLLVAGFIQAVRFDGGRLSYFAPIFWFVGLSAGFPAHYTGLFSFILVLAINPAIPNPRLFLTAYGMILLGLGLVFGAPSMPNAMAAGLVLLVPLASLLSKRPVVIFSRKPRATAGVSG